MIYLATMVNVVMVWVTTLTSASTFDMSKILESATELLTWVITSMGSILKFITDNPIILVLFFISLISVAVGFIFRIWRSVG